jgi:hypothetical protein
MENDMKSACKKTRKKTSHFSTPLAVFGSPGSTGPGLDKLKIVSTIRKNNSSRIP